MRHTQRAIDKFGSQSALARALDTKPSTVHQWIKRGRVRFRAGSPMTRLADVLQLKSVSDLFVPSVDLELSRLRALHGIIQEVGLSTVKDNLDLTTRLVEAAGSFSELKRLLSVLEAVQETVRR
jgi:hypothetical protein